MSETATKTKRAPLFREEQIEIDTVVGRRVITAMRLGALAYHQRLMGDGSFDPGDLTVTHVQSGLRVRTWLDEAGARRLVRALQSLDWGFSDPQEMPAETKREAGRIIRELGL